MYKLLNMFKSKENAYSIGRICALFAFIAFLIVSLYLVLRGSEWAHYEMFCVMCGGIYLAQLANKAFEIGIFKVHKDGEQ